MTNAARADQPPLPAWARTLQRRIRQRGVDFFILYGPGARDIHPLSGRRYGTIKDFLAEVTFADRTVILTYDRGAGVGFTDEQAANDFKTVLKAYDKLGGTSFAQAQPRDPDRALQLIETYLTSQLTGNSQFSAAVILDYGETLAPSGNAGAVPVEDRNAVVTLRRWASEPLFLRRNVTFCLVTEHITALNAELVAEARTFEITIPVPDEQERLTYLANRGSTPALFSRIDARVVARLTGGLTRLHLESLAGECESGGVPLDTEAVLREKKRLIEESSSGMLSFVTSTDSLDAVSGHDAAKALLRETAAALRQGRLDCDLWGSSCAVPSAPARASSCAALPRRSASRLWSS